MDDKALESALKAWRDLLANEEGTEPPCPWCKKPRVRRTDYIRCNRCATNWLDRERDLPEYLKKDPRVARSEAAQLTLVTAGSLVSGGSPARSASRLSAEPA